MPLDVGTVELFSNGISPLSESYLNVIELVYRILLTSGFFNRLYFAQKA